MTSRPPPPGITSIGASAVIFRADGHVLVIERGKPPFAGVWSLPGGHIEPGEPAHETARREVLEETGIAAVILGHLMHFDVPQRDTAGRIERTFGLEVYFGTAAADAEAVAHGDARDARFVPRHELTGYVLTERCAELIEAAWERYRHDPEHAGRVR